MTSLRFRALADEPSPAKSPRPVHCRLKRLPPALSKQRIFIGPLWNLLRASLFDTTARLWARYSWLCGNTRVDTPIVCLIHLLPPLHLQAEAYIRHRRRYSSSNLDSIRRPRSLCITSIALIICEARRLALGCVDTAERTVGREDTK